MDTLTAVVSISGAAISGGGFTWLVNSIARRGTAPAENAKVLTDAAMLQVDQLQERVKDAEAAAARAQQRTHEVEQEAEDARQAVRAVRRECADLAERMAQLARWIHQPDMTIEVLRARVPLVPSQNGISG